MRSIDSELTQIKVSLLQLQRSALIDTQTIMQILIQSGVCNIDDIVDMRTQIEDSSPEVARINKEITLAGGSVQRTPDSPKQQNIKEQIAILEDLIKQFNGATDGST